MIIILSYLAGDVKAKLQIYSKRVIYCYRTENGARTLAVVDDVGLVGAKLPTLQQLSVLHYVNIFAGMFYLVQNKIADIRK